MFVDLQTNASFWSYHSEGCMLQYVSSESRVYRIAGIFRGYKCSWFSRIKACTANIYNRCKKAAIPRKLRKAFPWEFIPSKYTRYTVHMYHLFTQTLH